MYPFFNRIFEMKCKKTCTIWNKTWFLSILVYIVLKSNTLSNTFAQRTYYQFEHIVKLIKFQNCHKQLYTKLNEVTLTKIPKGWNKKSVIPLLQCNPKHVILNNIQNSSNLKKNSEYLRKKKNPFLNWVGYNVGSN